MAKEFDIHEWQAKQRKKSSLTEAAYVDEHHNDENFPKLSKDALSILDFLQNHHKTCYDAVEDYIKSTNEASMMGTGASFQAGSGMGHFGKKKKKNN